MILVEGLAGRLMGEGRRRRLVILVVAVVAAIIHMTACASAVSVLPGAAGFHWMRASSGAVHPGRPILCCGSRYRSLGVAACAGVLVVTGSALDPKSPGVLIVPEKYIWPGHGREAGHVLPGRGGGDRLVHPPRDIVGCRCMAGRRLCGAGSIASGMADHTRVRLHPIAVAVQALPVIRALQAGQVNTDPVIGKRMTGFARRHRCRVIL